MGLYLGKEKVSNVASVITLSAEGMAAEMQNHIANTDIHITADERTKQNAAAENTEDFASTGVMNTNINMNYNSIKNLATPIENTDATNKAYVDSKALPTTSASDNGKFLRVVNGAWAAVAMSSGTYVSNYTGDGSANKTLTFNFKPGILILYTMDSDSRGCIQVINGQREFFSDGRSMGTIVWDNNNVIITFTTRGVNDMNSVTNVYPYAAIPAMN